MRFHGFFAEFDYNPAVVDNVCANHSMSQKYQA
jgi:hypothetical protein